jgi:CheY-like chemotaxis protein/phosphoribosyl 1,2-cyclic phosphodiesterase
MWAVVDGTVRVRFWGTRGSLAKPGPATLRYGGNTSCVEIRAADGTLIVLDCGTGAHDLGRALLAEGRPTRGHLLISHTHWDHIQGFPFFGPLFTAGHEWDVYAPQGLGQRLEATLGGQMEFQYFPVTLKQLGATVRYHDLAEGTFAVGGATVTARYLNHPGVAMGYRIESAGVAVVYATDHEPHSLHQPVHLEDQRHIDFLAGADLVVHDAQYTLEEYPEKLTWGHSPAEWAVDFALTAGAKRLALFHHDPTRDDDAVDAVLATCRARAHESGGDLEVFAAAEGRWIDLEPRGAAASTAGAAPSTMERATPALILVADDDRQVNNVVREILEAEGFSVLTASDGEAALALALRERPDLILLDWMMPGRSGLEICQVLRGEQDPRLRDVPVILLTARGEAEDTAAGFEAGVTDYLTKPFKASFVLARIHTWLLRRQGSA